MLEIRPAQLEVLERLDRAQFEADVTARMLERHPERLQTLLGQRQLADAAAALVARLVQRALDHGIDEEGDVEDFVGLSLVHGPGFENAPEREWAQALLTNPALPGDEKAALLRARLERGG